MKKSKACIDYCTERLYFFVFLFYYIFVKNLFINFILACILAVIIISKESFIVGPFSSFVITFNLVNGYAYYSKWVNWKRVKTTVLQDVKMFFIGYISRLSAFNFPLHEEDISEHSDIDEFVKEIPLDKFSDYYLAYDKYERYFFTLIENDKIELQYNKNNMDSYKNFLKSSIEKINQNILLTTVMFYENQNVINQLSALSGYICYQIDYNLDDGSGDGDKLFLGNVVELIRQIKKIIEVFTKIN